MPAAWSISQATSSFAPGFAKAAKAALREGAPILCDARMVSEGVTRARLPADNPVICTLQGSPRPRSCRADGHDPLCGGDGVCGRPHLEGAVIAIGNAPTSLFPAARNARRSRDTPAPPRSSASRSAFVGAVESKEALMADGRVPGLIVRGRRGGSAVTVAAINRAGE